MEVGYLILYHFNLILGVFSYLAPDSVYNGSRISVIHLKIYYYTTVPRIKGCCHWDTVGAKDL